MLFVVLLAASCLVSCRQSDGPMPVVEGDVPGRLADLSRDLLNVAARVPDARREFADDLAVFADAGSVAGLRRDLDLSKQSFGAGLRLHTRRETFAIVDVANGDEGWRVLFRLKDPLSLSRLTKKKTLVPFVP